MLHHLNDGIGKLILRVMLGGLMLPHGISKAINGVGGIERMLAGAGLPEWFAYGVFIGEIVAPLLLIVGFYARWGALLIVVNMLFAIMLAHSHEVLTLTARGAWAIELQAFFLFTAVAVMFTGPGAFAINRR